MSSPISETALRVPLHKVVKGAEGKVKAGAEHRTNTPDVNKEMSEQIVRPYINYAEALGDLPTGLNIAVVHWGPFEVSTPREYTAALLG